MQMTGYVLKDAWRHEAALASSMDVAGRRADGSFSSYSTTASGRVRMVRENMASYSTYESEGSESRTLGSIPVAPGAHWTVTLTVPIPPRDIAFLQLERRGELPAGYLGAEESALLSLPIGEADALIALLVGVVAQARRDGVLPTE
jgi:hypothetical protein